VADVPDSIVLKRHRDFVGRRYTLWPRWTILGLITLVCVLALLNLFGQRPSTASASTSVAKLTVYAPTKLRGGLLFSARFHITARRALDNATLVLDPGWAEGMSVNTIEPSPLGEGSKNGRLTLQLGHVAAGESYILFMQFQVNPTNVASRRPQNVELDDGETKVLTIRRNVTIYP
jgi:hypothetical protein